MLNHYEILGVEMSASDADIKTAYRTMSKKHHPDLNGAGSGALFAAVNNAYKVLSDSASRQSYDWELANADSNPGKPEPKQDYSRSGFSDSDTGEEPAESGSGNRKKFYNDDIEQEVVDWGAYDWHGKDYSGVSQRVVNPKPYRYLSALWSAVYPAMAIMSFLLLGSVESDHFILWLWLFFVIQVAFIFQWKKRRQESVSLFFHGIHLSWMGFLVYWAISGIPEHLSTSKFMEAAIFVVPAIFAATACVLSNYYSVRFEDETPQPLNARYARATKKDMLEYYSWGVAGDLGEATEKFGAENVHKGIIGEKYTESLFGNFASIPGVRVFHGLRFPGTRNADVDHAIMCGNNIVFVDSKQWSSGQYEWLQDGGIKQTTPSRDIMRETHFHNAVSSYIRRLPSRINVYAVTMVHGTGITVAGDPVFNGLRLANTVDGINYIGSILTSEVTGTIDMPVVNMLIGSMK